MVSVCPQLWCRLSPFFLKLTTNLAHMLVSCCSLGFLPRARFDCVCARVTCFALSHREISHLPFPDVGVPTTAFRSDQEWGYVWVASSALPPFYPPHQSKFKLIKLMNTEVVFFSFCLSHTVYWWTKVGEYLSAFILKWSSPQPPSLS